MQDLIEKTLRDAAAVNEGLVAQSEKIAEIAQALVDVYRAGGSLYLMGNGGSAADCQHMAGELVSRFLMEREPLHCLALTTDTSIMTAIGNDYTFADVFVKQVKAFVREGDAVLGISTSGTAANVNAGLDEARKRGALTIGLTGRDGGPMAGKCDLVLIVDSQETPRIQEGHATVIHILCDLIERALFGAGE